MSEKHYFLTGNTSQGRIDFTLDTLKNMNYIYLVDGPFSENNNIILDYTYEALRSKDIKLDIIHQSSNPSKLHAILIPDYHIAVLNSSPPFIYDKDLFESTTKLINMYDHYFLDVIETNKHRIDHFATIINDAHKRAYHHYKQAIAIHDDWEAIYIKNMDFGKANVIAEQLISELIPEENVSEEAKLHIRFLGAATPEGAVDFVPNLTNGLTRYLIKGRPGSGKSTLLKAVLAAAKQKGYEIEVYHCGLDPNSLDMIIVRELGFALFDSTAPHEYFPEFKHDHVIDMYELCIKPLTDEKFAEELEDIKVKYNQQMKLGLHALQEANQAYVQRQAFTQESVHKPQINQLKVNLIREIEHIIKT